MNDEHPAGAAARLEVRVARKAYAAADGGRFDVLHDVAFALAPGTVGALVGPSGCGKTTLLRIVAGLDADFDGDVVHRVDGRIGMVFQEPRLLPWRSVEDNVRLVAPAADETRLDELFRTLEIDQHRAHTPGELSLGLARRVALARAFAVDPDLLLLDEPFVSLDDALAARLRDELALLIDRAGVATLLVTHDLDEAARLADRVMVLSARPARILAELAIATPRARRGAAEIAAIGAELARAGSGRPEHVRPLAAARPTSSPEHDTPRAGPY